MGEPQVERLAEAVICFALAVLILTAGAGDLLGSVLAADSLIGGVLVRCGHLY